MRLNCHRSTRAQWSILVCIFRKEAVNLRLNWIGLIVISVSLAHLVFQSSTSRKITSHDLNSS
ncbi:hypothetical protein DL98DRAFT_102133 [Cadophora sp. DSE1049]|nr:hypothetical protein DL98DRAFT_102133 [Cadophora sp. DSE1049]